MRMNLEILSPGVKYGEEADIGPQVFGIGCDRLQSFGGGLEENTVDDFLILISDRGDLFRYGEDHMIVGDLQKLGLPVLDPLRAGQTLAFGAVSIATAIERRCVHGRTDHNVPDDHQEWQCGTPRWRS